MFEAKVIADSICNGHRLTTMQVTHPRIVHAEFMTHCMFARNASSSRAIPFSKQVEKVKNDPFIPVFWGKNQKGMQAVEELSPKQKEVAIRRWLEARDVAVMMATEMASEECLTCKGTGSVPISPFGLANIQCPDCGGDGLGLNVHKQIVNRLIEPWSFITVCYTGTEDAFSNYFALRCEKDAQPEIQKQAYMSQKAYYESTPKELKYGEWHLPYLDETEIEEMKNWTITQEFDFHPMVKISVGRCARTSYLTQEGKRDYNEDVKLHDRLRFHVPLHASPFEHVCMAMGDDKRYGKYTGWKAYRHFLPREYVTDFKANHPDIIGKSDD